MTEDGSVREEQAVLFEEGYAVLSSQMRSLHISRINEMPRIELYLDQVLSIVSSELAFMYAPGEKVVTGAMVNNYVKQRIVPPPTRKRYTRRHLASLLFICSLKNVLSISQIAQILEMASQLHVDVERTYNDMLELFELTLAGLFPEDPFETPTRYDGHLQLMDSDGNRVGGTPERLLEDAVFLLAYKVYADQMLALEARCLECAG